MRQSKGNDKDYCLDLFYSQKTDTKRFRASSAKRERKTGDFTRSVLYRAIGKRIRLYFEKTERVAFEKVEDHRIRARIPHFEENEPSISYYARMEKIMSGGSTIQSLYDKNGIQQSETSQVLKITEDYYSDLFRAGKTN